MGRFHYRSVPPNYHLAQNSARQTISVSVKQTKFFTHPEFHSNPINQKTPASSTANDWKLPFNMADNRPEELKGWPKSWYKDGDVNGYLECPVDGCEKVFQNAEQVRTLLNHAVEPDDPTIPANVARDIRFRHRILVAMVNVTKCPKCPDPYEFEFDSIPEVRELFDHERDEHGSEDFSDVNKFIGLIREYREEEFGDGPKIWYELYEYYQRQIRKHPRYLDFQSCLQRNYELFRRGPGYLIDEHFNVLARGDRHGNDFGNSEEDLQKYKWCYPVKSDEFLSLLGPPPRDPEHILNVFKKAYSEGQF